MLNDWNRGSIQSFSPHPYPKPSATFQTINSSGTGSSNSLNSSNNASFVAKVSSIEFINGHDQALIMAGYDDGCIRIWRPSTASANSENTKESKLITAWQAITDLSYSNKTSSKL